MSDDDYSFRLSDDDYVPFDISENDKKTVSERQNIKTAANSNSGGGRKRKATPQARRRTNKKAKTMSVIDTLHSRIGALSKEQLIDIVVKHFKDKSDNDVLKFMNDLPKADLAPIKDVIESLETSYQRSFPNNRYGSSYDTYSYNRVCRHLNSFKRALLKPIDEFKKLKNWESLAEYCEWAETKVQNMPTWDLEKHNKSRILAEKKIDKHLQLANKHIT